MSIRLSSAAPMRGAKRWAFIERGHTIHVASQSGDDTIYVSPLWYVVQDRRIFIPLDQASRHGKNIAAGGLLSAVVDKGEEIGYVRGVNMEGTGQIVEDAAFADELQEMVLQKYFYKGDPYLEDYVNFGKYYGRRFYEIVVTKIYGWDLREAGILATPERHTLPAHVLNGDA
jgi:hypothetical protein